MPRLKVKRNIEPKEVVYSNDHWELLWFIRTKGEKILECLQKHGMTGYIYGSPARGDVHEGSDIDIFIYEKVSSFKIDLALMECGLSISMKEIVLPTPNETIKGIFYLSDQISITTRLTRFLRKGFDFYKFAGCVNLEQIRKKERVAGVNKALVVIEPKEYGHVEYSLIGNEHKAKQILGVDEEIINQRSRVLQKRDKIGRTGILFSQIFDPEVSLEDELQKIAKRNNIIRRRIRMSE